MEHFSSHSYSFVFSFPTEDIFAWTDSTIVLNWLVGNPRRFKTFVGNWILLISDLVTPNRWSHVEEADNPADCTSRGLFPSEHLSHTLWWNGPSWLQLGIHCWPKPPFLTPNNLTDEVNEIYSHAVAVQTESVIVSHPSLISRESPPRYSNLFSTVELA